MDLFWSQIWFWLQFGFGLAKAHPFSNRKEITPSGEGDGDALNSKIELSLVLLKFSMTKVLIQGKIIDHGKSAKNKKDVIDDE